MANSIVTEIRKAFKGVSENGKPNYNGGRIIGYGGFCDPWYFYTTAKDLPAGEAKLRQLGGVKEPNLDLNLKGNGYNSPHQRIRIGDRWTFDRGHNTVTIEVYVDDGKLKVKGEACLVSRKWWETGLWE